MFHFLAYIPKIIAILRFMIEVTPVIQKAEALFPEPGQGTKKKSLVMGFISKAIAFLGETNIIKEDQAEVASGILGIADRAIDGAVEVLNDSGMMDETAAE